MPLELEDSEQITFRSFISTTVAQIHLKFNIRMCPINIQIEIEFISGLMTFDTVMSPELRKK